MDQKGQVIKRVVKDKTFKAISSIEKDLGIKASPPMFWVPDKDDIKAMPWLESK